MTRLSRQIDLPDPAATAALGAALGALLKPGDIVYLQGGLGAGKSTLARGLIEAVCGIPDAPSPTYTLLHSYAFDDGELAHADLYRVEEEAELAELGLEDYFDDAITLIEWPDRLCVHAPPRRLVIDLAEKSGGRSARLTPIGDWSGVLDDA